MRCSVLLASTLAVGALAMPHIERRATRYRISTVTDVETITVLVTVTLDINIPTGIAPAVSAEITPTPSISDIVGPDAALVSSTRSFGNFSQAILNPSASPVDGVSSGAAASPTPGTSPSNVGPAHLSGPQQASLSSGPEYMNAVLYHHNAARANHGAAPLTWDPTCEDNARIAAQKCAFEHFLPEGVSEGQNLFTVSGTAFNVTAGITESWYKNELPLMDGYFGQPSLPDDVFHDVGHFTQVVWKGTTGVGCVTLDCGDRMTFNGEKIDLNKFTVCNYSPAGNIVGQYGNNVQPPISSTNLGRWDD